MTAGIAGWLFRMIAQSAIWGLLPWIGERTGLGWKAGLIGGIAGALADVHQKTAGRVAETHRTEAFLAGQFVTQLLVGLNRWARGEVLSGHEFVKTHAVGNLLALLPMVLEPADPDVTDVAEPRRHTADRMQQHGGYKSFDISLARGRHHRARLLSLGLRLHARPQRRRDGSTAPAIPVGSSRLATCNACSAI